MQPAPAKNPDAAALEKLGRATLEIVHDLKNQLNGLKLYATFLRKRLERDDQPIEERETLAKLIGGLDRAAKDLTALVRYARPLELRVQPHTDLRRVVSKVIADAAERETGGLPRATIAAQIEGDAFYGDFDPVALNDAIKAITDDTRATLPSKDPQTLSISMRAESGGVVIEWRGGNFTARSGLMARANGAGTIYTELATRIIEAQGGNVNCEKDVIRVWLPLTNTK
jgi:light-regulated signal transduction histidine kinase (bacteriophytochrome)